MTKKKTKKSSDRREYTYRVDLDGKLWHDGTSIDVPSLYEAFFRTMQTDERGRLFALCQGERCWIVPDDAPFVVDSIEEQPSGAPPRPGPREIVLLLAGGVRSPLDPRSLHVGDANVLYARVRDGRFRARFSRKAYYQLAPWVAEHDGGYALRLAGQLHPISIE